MNNTENSTQTAVTKPNTRTKIAIAAGVSAMIVSAIVGTISHYPTAAQIINWLIAFGTLQWGNFTWRALSRGNNGN
jgi:hypothetical protein